MQALKPCPFCGGDDISSGEVMGTRNRDGSAFHQTACLGCGACSAECDSVEQADEAWNTRHEATHAGHTISREEMECVARAINERANKDYNAYMLGKHESFALAKAALATLGIAVKGE